MFTVVIPFWNGHRTLPRLLKSIPQDIHTIIVDDCSDKPPNFNRPNTQLIRLSEKGFFAGAVNAGAKACNGDFLILNQDAWLSGRGWLNLIESKRDHFATIGHGVMKHKLWPRGYVQGTFMFVRRDAWDKVGEFNVVDYPLWGCTAEWQLRACRAGYRALPLENVPGFSHDENRRRDKRRYGESITALLHQMPKQRERLLRTPPLMSVVIPCYNYGRYLEDAINSLIGGPTCLGDVHPQTFQSFEIVIVDDRSTDDSWQIIQSLVDDWKGIRAIRLKQNRGTPICMNAGVKSAHGKYIHILSADDMREHWQLERLLRATQANPHSFAFSSVMVFKDGQRIKELELPEYNFEKVVKRNLVPAGIVYPKTAWEEVGGYPEIMVHGREDWAFNVGLGRAGWCGVKVAGFGNLYRREHQNRSWRTGNQHRHEPPSPEAVEWRRFFQDQMESLYPGIYRGERPMGCCGNKSGKRTPKTSKSIASSKQLPGQSGMIVMEYVGGSNSTKSFWANQTRYRFGGKRLQGYVAVEDVPALKNQYPGLFIEGPRQPPKPPERGSKAAPVTKPTVVDNTSKSESPPDNLQPAEPQQEPQAAIDEPVELVTLPGIGKSLAQKLESAGYNTVKDLARAVPGELAEVKGISFGKAMNIVDAAKGAISAAS